MIAPFGGAPLVMQAVNWRGFSEDNCIGARNEANHTPANTPIAAAIA